MDTDLFRSLYDKYYKQKLDAGISSFVDIKYLELSTNGIF